MKLRKLPVYETVDGVKIKRPSKKWYGVFCDHAGVLRRLPLLEDRQASSELARTVGRLNSLRSSNETVFPSEVVRAVEAMPAAVVKSLARWDLLGTARVAASKPLVEHVADWENELQSRGNTSKHAVRSAFNVNRVFKLCGFNAISDVKASAVLNVIADLRKDRVNREGKPKRGMSIGMSNHLIQACKGFFKWMVEDHRIHENPLIHLKLMKAATDTRHDRRALSADEIRWLLETTTNAGEIRGMSGPSRAMLYRIALETGLRSSELRSLTRGGFQIDGDNPSVTVAAAYTKNSDEAHLPLRPSTAAALGGHLAGKMPQATVFDMPTSDKMIFMYRADLAAARKAWLESHTDVQERLEAEQNPFLAYIDDQGRYADFHALRHTFITNLCNGGVHPKTAQTLARHKSITLTMDRYTHVRREDLAGALDTLPDISTPIRKPMIATGTDCLSLPLSPKGEIRRNSVALGAINRATVGDTGLPENKGENAIFSEKSASDSQSAQCSNLRYLIRCG